MGKPGEPDPANGSFDWLTRLQVARGAWLSNFGISSPSITIPTTGSLRPPKAVYGLAFFSSSASRESLQLRVLGIEGEQLAGPLLEEYPCPPDQR